MAMREVENMLDELDQMNDYYKNNYGEEMPHLFELQDKIDVAVDEIINAFNTSVDKSRELLKLDRKKLNGEMSLDMYTKKKTAILNEIEKAEYKGEEYLKKLNSYADTLGIEQPQGRHKNAYSFARELVGEYHAFSHAYLQAQKRSIQYGVPFVLNEHVPHSKAIMDLANDSIQIAKKAMKEGVLPSDTFDGITSSPYLGKEDMIVRSGLGNIANDEPWQNVNAMIGIIRNDNGKRDTIPVPAIYYPERNVYLINERDYNEKIAAIGKPIAKVDVELPDHYDYKPFDGEGLNDMSILREYGYNAHNPKEERQYLIKAMLDEEILSKQAMQRYFEFRQKLCESNPKHKGVQFAIKEDKKFVDDYEPRSDMNVQIDNLNIKPGKDDPAPER